MNAKRGDRLYYQPPSDAIFTDLKKAAMRIWLGYDDEFGYATEKVNRIKDLKNVGDNFMFMIAMYDSSNQRKLFASINEDTKQAVRARLLDGGMIPDELYFLGL